MKKKKLIIKVADGFKRMQPGLKRAYQKHLKLVSGYMQNKNFQEIRGIFDIIVQHMIGHLVKFGSKSYIIPDTPTPITSDDFNTNFKDARISDNKQESKENITPHNIMENTFL